MPVFSNSVSATSTYLASKARNPGTIPEFQLLSNSGVHLASDSSLCLGISASQLPFLTGLFSDYSRVQRTKRFWFSFVPPGFFWCAKGSQPILLALLHEIFSVSMLCGTGKEMFCKLFQNFIIPVKVIRYTEVAKTELWTNLTVDAVLWQCLFLCLYTILLHLCLFYI